MKRRDMGDSFHGVGVAQGRLRETPRKVERATIGLGGEAH
jgi:hypothetical protein